MPALSPALSAGRAPRPGAACCHRSVAPRTPPGTPAFGSRRSVLWTHELGGWRRFHAGARSRVFAGLPGPFRATNTAGQVAGLHPCVSPRFAARGLRTHGRPAAPASLKQPQLEASDTSSPGPWVSLAWPLLCLGLVAFVGPQEQPLGEDVRRASLRGRFWVPSAQISHASFLCSCWPLEHAQKARLL